MLGVSLCDVDAGGGLMDYTLNGGVNYECYIVYVIV